MSAVSSTSSETERMLSSHRAKLLVLHADLTAARHQGAPWRHLEREIEQVAASIDRLHRMSL